MKVAASPKRPLISFAKAEKHFAKCVEKLLQLPQETADNIVEHLVCMFKLRQIEIDGNHITLIISTGRLPEDAVAYPVGYRQHHPDHDWIFISDTTMDEVLDKAARHLLSHLIKLVKKYPELQQYLQDSNKTIEGALLKSTKEAIFRNCTIRVQSAFPIGGNQVHAPIPGILGPYTQHIQALLIHMPLRHKGGPLYASNLFAAQTHLPTLLRHVPKLQVLTIEVMEVDTLGSSAFFDDRERDLKYIKRLPGMGLTTLEEETGKLLTILRQIDIPEKLIRIVRFQGDGRPRQTHCNWIGAENEKKLPKLDTGDDMEDGQRVVQQRCRTFAVQD